MKRALATIILIALAGLASAPAPARAAPLTAEAAASVERITTAPRYVNSSWGIAVQDAATGEQVYGQRAQEMFLTGSITKLFTGAAALERLGADQRLRTRVHRVGRVRAGVLDGDLALVAAGDFSFGLRDRRNGTLAYADGGADHNEANSLGLVKTVSGDPLRALRRLAADVRGAGIRRVRDVVIDDRLFESYLAPVDGPITPIWVNENLIDLTVRPTARGRRARVVWRPRTAAYRVTNRVRTGRATALELDEPQPGVIRIQGTIAAGGGPTVRSWPVSDPAAFARTAFIETLRRAGVRVRARATGDNPQRRLPRARTYATSTRLGQWTSPRLAEYVKVVLKISYNRGADLLVCLVGAQTPQRDCVAGLERVTRTVEGLGVPGDQFFNFDGAGSDDRNRQTPNALNRLNSVVGTQPWGPVYLASLPVLGEPGGGDIATFGTDSPARGKLQAKTGTRAGQAPGAPGLLLHGRGLSGYLTAASGRRLLVTIEVNNPTFQGIGGIVAIIEDQVAIVESIYRGA